MADAIQAKPDFAVLQEYIQDLLTECREAMEDAEDYVARAKKAREKSKELLNTSQNLKTH